MIDSLRDIQNIRGGSWLLVIFSCLLIIVGAGIQSDIVILFLMIGIVGISFILLWQRAHSLLNSTDIDWSRLGAEFVVPIILWILFGLGGLVSFFMPEVVTSYGASYEMTTVLIMAIYITLGAITYLLGFRWGFQDSQVRLHGKQRFSGGMLALFLTILLASDWYLRFEQISNGIYFTWLTAFAETVQATTRASNALYQFHDTIVPLTLSLLAYSFVKSTRKWPLGILLVTQSILIVLQGQRRDILLVTLVLSLTFLAIKRTKLSQKLVFTFLILAGLFVGFIGPVIEESRLEMRRDARALVAQPEEILVRFIVEYIPRSITPARIMGNTEASLRTQQGISFTERMGGYMSYAANIYQAILDGRADLNVDNFGVAISLIIPRAIYPDKPTVSANDMVYENFGFGRLGYDATGSPAADIFSYIHWPGIAALFFIVGLCYGLIAKHLRINYGQIGDMITIGLVPAIFPMGDAFGAYLATLRNILLLLILIHVFVTAYIIFFGNRISSKSSTTQATLQA